MGLKRKYLCLKMSRSLCMLGIPLNYSLLYFAVLNMLINKRFVVRPTSARWKKLKSYGGGQLYINHILEGVMFLSF